MQNMAHLDVPESHRILLKVKLMGYLVTDLLPKIQAKAKQEGQQLNLDPDWELEAYKQRLVQGRHHNFPKPVLPLTHSLLKTAAGRCLYIAKIFEYSSQFEHYLHVGHGHNHNTDFPLYESVKTCSKAFLQQESDLMAELVVDWLVFEFFQFENS